MLLLFLVFADLQAPGTTTAVLHRVDVHLAARLWAEAHHADIIAVGGGAVDLAFDDADSEAALERIAQAAGLKVARVGRLHVLAPPQVIAALPSRVRFNGGRRIDLDFIRANVQNLLHLFGDLDERHIDSQLSGEVTIRAVDIPVRDLIGWLAALARAPLAVQKHKLVIGAGVLPAPETPLMQSCNERSSSRLGCVANDDIEVAAIAWGSALVHGPAADGPHSSVVRAGDRLGASGVLVKKVAADHLELDGGGRIGF